MIRAMYSVWVVSTWNSMTGKDYFIDEFGEKKC